MKLVVHFGNPSLSINFSEPALGVSTGIPIVRDGGEFQPYEGEYEVTPSLETQVLETNGLRMTRNVTINPIPSNYGLITWNGSVLTVS